MYASKPGRPPHILLVEDDPNDVELTRQGFLAAAITVTLDHVENGAECLRYLKREDRYADAQTPDLVVLDLNMAVMNGREVLERISAQPELRHLPVVILTTSSNPTDVVDLYARGCNAYVVKPVDFERFIELISQLCSFWFSVATLPSSGFGAIR